MGKRSTHVVGAIGADRELGGEAAATLSSAEADRSLAADPELKHHECKRRRRPKYPPEIVIDALRASGGIKSTAAAKLGCSRNTLDSYVRLNPKIAEALAEIEDEYLDLAEAVVCREILAGNLSVSIFYLKNKGARRGYGRQREDRGKNRTGDKKSNALDLKRTIDLQNFIHEHIPPDERAAFEELLKTLCPDDASSDRC